MGQGRARVVSVLIAGILAAGALVAQTAATAGTVPPTTTQALKACRAASSGSSTSTVLPAACPPTTHPLGVEVTGSGLVTSDPGGIACREGGIRRSARADNVCSDVYDEGTVVTLTAAPDPGHEFGGWGGDCTGTEPTCAVTLADVRSVTATFEEIPTYDLRTGVNGEGTVYSDPGDIECQDELREPARARQRDPDPCSDEFAEGTTVTLTAEPASDYAFSGWTTLHRSRQATGRRVPPHGCTGTDPTCELEMYEHTVVVATFVPAEPSRRYTLSVVTKGPGGGVVTSDPAGIACQRGGESAGDCAQGYDPGDTVTLTASPAAGSTFAGFGGACSGTTCVVSMTKAQSVTARFELPAGSLLVAPTGPGAGTVTSSPAGISCGATCTSTFPEGTEVTLVADPAAGSGFGGFTGCAATEGTTCTVVVGSGTTTVEARFTDTTAPQTRITRTPANPFNDHSLFRFVSSEAGSTFECSLDGGPRTDCSTPTDYRCLPAGGHVFRVWATDPSGNSDPTAAAHRFRVRSGPGC